MAEIGSGDQLERRLTRALQAEAGELTVRLDATDLETRWAARRGGATRFRNVFAACAVLAIVAVGFGWYGRFGNRVLNGSAGPIGGSSSSSMPAGLSTGQATLALTVPAKSSIDFDVKCVWSAGRRVVAISSGKQQIAGEEDTVLWQYRPGPRYEVQLQRDDGTVFGFTPSDPGSNYSSHVDADGRSGTITFKDLVLWSGDSATAPTRSGTFTWQCRAPLIAASPASVPSGHADSLDVPQLWVIGQGAPAFQTETGCPVTVEGHGTTAAGSCAYASWWESLKVSAYRYSLPAGSTFSLALDRWTITHASVRAIRATDAEALPVGAAPPDAMVVVLGDQLGPSVAIRAPQETGVWYVVFDLEAAQDGGAFLSGRYEVAIEVMR